MMSKWSNYVQMLVSWKSVAPGQYFMTKDAWEFSHFDGHVACREKTLLREDESSKPKGWMCGNTKVCPVLEVVTNYHQGKHGVEIGIESLSEDGSHSWIRISDGLNTFVRDLTEKKCESIKNMRTLWQARGNPSHETRRRCAILEWAQANLQRRGDQSKHQFLPHHLFQRVYQVIQDNGLMSNRENNMPGVTRL